jgi:hypothetical protein
MIALIYFFVGARRRSSSKQSVTAAIGEASPADVNSIRNRFGSPLVWLRRVSRDSATPAP